MNQQEIMEQFKEYLKYDKETGYFTWIKKSSYTTVIGGFAGTVRKDGYIAIRFNKKGYLAHRLAWFFYYGKWPEYIDHKNGNRSDNRIKNLREATLRQNQQNRIEHRNGRLIGAIKHRKNWRSHIQIFKKNIPLGNFQTELEAHKIYLLALKNIENFNGNTKEFRELLKTIKGKV